MKVLAKLVCRGGGNTLGEEFDPRSNALNAWRLLLATGVIAAHSPALTGQDMGLRFAPAGQLFQDVFVDGFFAMSGFLITWSWFRRPRPREYFLARGLRILPGLWACLIVTAFVIAPISVAIQGGSATKLLFSRAPIEFVVANSAVVQLQQGIDGTPRGVPWPGQWNGSLWTLTFEVFCYVTVAAFGLVGLLRQRWLIPTCFALALFSLVRLPRLSTFDEVVGPDATNVDAATAFSVIAAEGARLFLMFFAGALLYQLRNVIPARWSLVGLSTVIVAAASFMPDYRFVGAIPLAYTVIASGMLLHHRRLRLQTDLSYGVYIYAWPVQELLVISGLTFLHPMVFAVAATIATLPLAALSWFLVEKPALSVKSRLKQRSEALNRVSSA